jgi:hypothetical protein
VTDVLKMEPSAEERVNVRITNVSGPTIVVHRQAAQELVTEAFRDGAKGERILSMLPMLREKALAAFEDEWVEIYKERPHSMNARRLSGAAVGVIADTLDAGDPT